MVTLANENQCCGCSACSVVCPQHCIEMQEGTLGHLFPHIEVGQCVSCGLCDKVCPMKTEIKETDYNQKAYAAYATDKEVRFRGSSGGMFEIFSRVLLKQRFLIYGAAFTKELNLKCVQANSEETLGPLMKSKYLQSDMHEKFDEIQSLLLAGKNVMFTSTPCQIVALKNYLRKPYPNLITVDFFCHGVPSQRFFHECLTYDETRRGIKIDSFMFRVKKANGSTPHYCSIGYTKNNIHHTKSSYYFDTTFYACFQKYICLRESCYNCRFSSQNRISDITIGDFHDIDRYVSGINRFDGVSTVIINSHVGEKLWNSCMDSLNVYPARLDHLVRDGVCFSGGTKRPKSRDDFVDTYNCLGVQGVADKYVKSTQYIKDRIYYSLPKTIRKAVKSIGE
ncbi:MAG: Coenzyme F420 hydrogenase/dehydrogenase, beta subunit C-terminal domain [Oscillospiraceae bacterium]|nr:Coenzyme F420 hydrogenase/dehydrogenase, beta subunit C-terminal domain [Oscillospiraceae bacterium]